MRYFNLLAFFIGLSILVGCGPSGGIIDIDIDGPESELVPFDPTQTEIDSYIDINGVKLDVKSAGYYYTETRKGYSFVFTTSVTDLSGPLSDLPEGYVLSLDIPASEMNLMNNVPTIIQGELWKFYLKYVVDRKEAIAAGSDDIVSSSFKSGKLSVFFENGILEVKFRAEVINNDKIELSYKGKPVKSDEYIIAW